jgi:hypothetical protein
MEAIGSLAAQPLPEETRYELAPDQREEIQNFRETLAESIRAANQALAGIISYEVWRSRQPFMVRANEETDSDASESKADKTIRGLNTKKLLPLVVIRALTSCLQRKFLIAWIHHTWKQRENHTLARYYATETRNEKLLKEFSHVARSDDLCAQLVVQRAINHEESLKMAAVEGRLRCVHEELVQVLKLHSADSSSAPQLSAILQDREVQNER